MKVGIASISGCGESGRKTGVGIVFGHFVHGLALGCVIEGHRKPCAVRALAPAQAVA